MYLQYPSTCSPRHNQGYQVVAGGQDSTINPIQDLSFIENIIGSIPILDLMYPQNNINNEIFPVVTETNLIVFSRNLFWSRLHLQYFT